MRSISTLVVLLVLALGASLDAMAQGRRGKLGRHDNGRHRGWTIGRHRGWSHSHHRGVRTDDSLLGSVLRRNRRARRDVLVRRDNRDFADVARGRGRGRGRH